MKISEMNGHQQTAMRLMKEQYNDYMGGLENTLLDNDPDSQYYKSAMESLNDPAGCALVIYDETVYWANRYGFAKHMRFAGKEWLMERICRKLKKDGYWPDYQNRPEYDLVRA